MAIELHVGEHCKFCKKTCIIVHNATNDIVKALFYMINVPPFCYAFYMYCTDLSCEVPQKDHSSYRGLLARSQYPHILFHMICNVKLRIMHVKIYCILIILWMWYITKSDIWIWLFRLCVVMELDMSLYNNDHSSSLHEYYPDKIICSNLNKCLVLFIMFYLILNNVEVWWYYWIIHGPYTSWKINYCFWLLIQINFPHYCFIQG